jgi:4-hydroxy-tetrahydrodipicolinate synthase
MGRFGTVGVAMATPFAADGSLDADGAATLARWLGDHGVDFLVLAGTTGESPTLTDDETIALLESVRAAVDLPVLAGTSSNDTAHSVEMTRRASVTGVDGILAVCPYYSRPSQAGLDAHFRAVAEATDLPVMLYDIPIRTGRKIDTATVVRLADDVANIVALKDASGDPAESARLLAAAPAGFELYSGEDSLNLPLLAVGGVGFVSVAAHWSGVEHGEMARAFAAGEVDKAREINTGLLASYAFETGIETPNPMPTKAMLRVLGLPAGQCRLPIGPAPEGLEDAARGVLDGLGPR